ncbi:hypothetical protein RclHR1_07510006 [Rhizophagus clarus]|uniref:BTB domain-containing protein n=1 Tax=Rhizophagus clarus TaxID=94130 RepID=A0A2Z6SCH0_9GLOM|nr:hypothetical protein RclHR1_07510006 [Rhizophagus clarus]
MESLYITEYLESTEPSRWNLLGVFQHVSSKTNGISNADKIVEIFKQRLECRSKDPSVLKSVQNKARQLSQQLNISQPDIVEFLDNQELIIAQNQEEHDPSYARAIGRLYHFKDFENLYEEDKFKDVTIKVDNKAFKGHFSILYARSPFFREILPKHGTYGEISIPKITANSFEVMLRYMYSGMISLDDYEPSDFFDLLHAAIKLELTEIVDYLKDKMKLVLQQ